MQQTYRGFILPTPEEEAAIQRGIELDPDTWNLSYEEFERLESSAAYHRRQSMSGELPAA
jgi:hypothetical protein